MGKARQAHDGSIHSQASYAPHSGSLVGIPRTGRAVSISVQNISTSLSEELAFQFIFMERGFVGSLHNAETTKHSLCYTL
jgi:hypothetical protein